MVIYIYNILSIPLYYIFIKAIKTRNDKTNILVGILCVQMTFIAGMRGVKVGVDTQTYQWIFDAIQNLNWSELYAYYIEFGYTVINKIVGALGGTFRETLLLIAFIIYTGIYRLIKETSCDKMMSIFLFISFGYFASSMNIMRQFCALTFIIFAYIEVMKKKSIKKILFYCMIAFLFHKSSILCLGVIFVYYLLEYEKIKSSGLLKPLVLVGAIIACLFVGKIFSVLGLNVIYMSEGAGYTYNLFSVSFLIKILLLISGYIAMRRVLDENEIMARNLGFLNFLNMVSCFMNILSAQYSMFTRLNIYFSVGMIVLIPNIIEYLPIKNKNVMRMIVYVAFTFLFYTQLLGNDNLIIPYNTEL